jgi:hypothetical protein
MSTPTEYQILRERHDRMREGIAALADEWERDDTDHLNSFGQHLPGSVLRMSELLRERVALLDQEDA